MIELWHEWNSVHSFKVRIVLAEKGLDWASRVVRLLAFEHLQADYLAINADGVVPTMRHDGRLLADSSPLCEYLDDAFPQPPLMSADALGKHAARRWLKYHDDVAHHALRDASFQLLYKPRFAAMPAAQLEAAVARHPRPERRKKFLDARTSDIDWSALVAAVHACDAVAARIDAALAHGGAWLLGRDFTLADVAMAPFAERVVNLGIESIWKERSACAAWAQRLLARASVQSARPPPAERLPRPDEATLARLREALTETAP